MPQIVTPKKLEVFSKSHAYFSTENGSTINEVVWSSDRIENFKKYWDHYNTCKDNKKYFEAWCALQSAIGEFWLGMQWACCFQNLELIKITKKIAQQLNEDNLFIADKFELVLKTTPSYEQPRQRAIFNVDRQTILKVINLSKKAIVIHSEKSFFEQFKHLVNLHPIKTIVIGMGVGFVAGGVILFIAPELLVAAKLMTTLAGTPTVVPITIGSLIGAVLGAGTAGILVYNLKDLEVDIATLRKYKILKEKLGKNLEIVPPDLGQEIDRQETKAKEKIIPKNASNDKIRVETDSAGAPGIFDQKNKKMALKKELREITDEIEEEGNEEEAERNYERINKLIVKSNLEEAQKEIHALKKGRDAVKKDVSRVILLK